MIVRRATTDKAVRVCASVTTVHSSHSPRSLHRTAHHTARHRVRVGVPGMLATVVGLAWARKRTRQLHPLPSTPPRHPSCNALAITLPAKVARSTPASSPAAPRLSCATCQARREAARIPEATRALLWFGPWYTVPCNCRAVVAACPRSDRAGGGGGRGGGGTQRRLIPGPPATSPSTGPRAPWLVAPASRPPCVVY